MHDLKLYIIVLYLLEKLYFLIKCTKYILYIYIKHVPQIRITVELPADIENSRNLMFVRSEQSFIEGFDHTEVDGMMQYITGH